MEYIPASGSDRFEKLAAGTIDVLIRTTTWTTSRDADLNADFAGMNFYDGQGILVRSDVFPYGTGSADQLANAKVCVGVGTTTEGNLVDWFGSRSIDIEVVGTPDATESVEKLKAGTCDAFTGDMSAMVARKWLLDNVFGSPPPPPPANVPEFPENERGVPPKSVRERLELHRSNPVCAACHSTIDPLGFALEHFDAIGGWRTSDESGNPIDAVGRWPDGRELNGISDLRTMLVDPPEHFGATVTEKLMSYALGRRLEYYDRPAIRRIVRDAKADNFRWSSIIKGIVESPTFLMRKAP